MVNIGVLLGGEEIDYDQIGARILGVPEFRQFVGDEYLSSLSQALIENRDDEIGMMKCIREVMIVNFFMSVSDWGNISPEDMIQMQGGMLIFGDAYDTYKQYSSVTGKTDGNIEAVTMRIEEGEVSQIREGISASTQNIVKGPDRWFR